MMLYRVHFRDYEPGEAGPRESHSEDGFPVGIAIALVSEFRRIDAQLGMYADYWLQSAEGSPVISPERAIQTAVTQQRELFA